MPSDKEQKRLKALLDAFDSGAVQPEELMQAIDSVVEIITQVKDALEAKNIELDSKLEAKLSSLTKGVIDANEAIQSMVADVEKLSKTEIEQVKSLIASEMARIEGLIPEMPEEFDASDIVEMLSAQKASLDSLSVLVAGENIRNALESFPEEEDKLKIEAVGYLRKELDDLKKSIQTSGQGSSALIARYMYQIGDVSLSNLQDGDVLIYNATTGLWENGTVSGGASAFTDLTDTPASYSGQAGKAVVVNGTEDGLEFTTPAGGGDMLAATYDPANGARQVAFDDDVIHPAVVSGNTTAANDHQYINVATATYTDPSPTEGKGYTVFVRNGTATVGGTGYSTAGTVIQRIFHSGAWSNYVYQVASTFAAASHTHTLADVTDVTASAAELNVLDGIPGTLTATELGYVDGVTSPIQTQLGNKVTGPASATDTAIALYDGTTGKLIKNSGLLVDASSNIVGPTTGFKITGGTATTADLTFQVTSSASATTGADMHFLVGASGATEAQTILNNGNIGVNNTAPTKKFQVNLVGTIASTPTYSTNEDGVVISRNSVGNEGYSSVRLYNENNSANIDSFVRATRAAGNAFLGLEIGTTTNHAIRFLTNGNTAEKMRLDATGQLAIGTTTADRLLHEEVSDAGTNTVVYGQRHSHITSGTATTGFGIGEEYELENASGTNRVAASHEISWSDATNASEDATYNLRLIRAGTLTTALSVSSTGDITADGVAVPTISSTSTLTNKTLTSPVINTGVSGTAVADVSTTNTGTSPSTIVTPDGLAGSYAGTKSLAVQVNGSASGSTALATGDGQAVIPIDSALNGMNITAVKAYVTTVSSSGSVTVNIRRSRRSSATARTIVDTLSTAITVEASEFESADATTAPVINTSNDDLQTGDMLLIDIDAAGTGVLGLTVLITAQLP